MNFKILKFGGMKLTFLRNPTKEESSCEILQLSPTSNTYWDNILFITKKGL